MPTPVFGCGGECQLAGSGSAGSPHIGSPTNVTFETSSPIRGSASIKLSATAGVSNFRIDATGLTGGLANGRRFIVGFDLRIPSSLPSNDLSIMAIQMAGIFGNYYFIYYQNSDQKLYLRKSDWLAGNIITGATGVSVVADTTYHIDLDFNSSANPVLLNGKVDGTSLGQVSMAEAAVDSYLIGWGWITNATGTILIDNIVVSTTAADYPIGSKHILPASPNADGTHVASGSNLVKGTTGSPTGGGNVNGASDVYQSVDELPLGGGGDFINQQSNATAEFAEIAFANSPGGYSTLNAVEVALGRHEANTNTGNSQHRLHDGLITTAPSYVANSFADVHTAIDTGKTMIAGVTPAQGQMIVIAASIAGTTATPPSGFQAIPGTSQPYIWDTTRRLYVWYKIAGASETNSYAFTHTSAGSWAAIWCEKDFDPVNPFGSAGIAFSSVGSGAQDPTNSEIVTVENSMLRGLWTYTSAGLSNLPSGFTERGDAVNTFSVSDKVQSTVGSTGTLTWDTSANGPCVTALYSLRPASESVLLAFSGAGSTTQRYTRTCLTAGPSGAAWSPSRFDSLTVRFGYSTDADPDQYADGYILEGIWDPPSGTAYVKSINDVVQINESVRRKLSLVRRFGEVVQINETVQRPLALKRRFADTVQVNETVQRKSVLLRRLADAVQVSETVLRRSGLSRRLSDVVQVSETTPRKTSLVRQLNDVVNLSDTVVCQLLTLVVKIFSDAIQISDAQQRILGLTRRLDDSVSIAETLSRKAALTRQINEVVQVPTTVARTLSLVRRIADTVEVNESDKRTLSLVRQLLDVVQVVTGLRRPLSLRRHLADTVQVQDTERSALRLTRQLADAVAISETVLKLRGIVRIFADTVQVVESRSRSLASSLVKVLSEVVQVVEARRAALGLTRRVSDTVAINESLGRPARWLRILNDTTTVNESINRPLRMLRRLSDTVQIVETVVRRKFFSKTLNDTVQVRETTRSFTSLFGAVIKILNDVVRVSDIQYRYAQPVVTRKLKAVIAQFRTTIGVVLNRTVAQRTDSQTTARKDD